LRIHFVLRLVNLSIGSLGSESDFHRQSAAHQAFDCRNQYADDSVAYEAVMNPVPGKPDHQENIADGLNIALGQNRPHDKNDSHGAVCPADREWNQ
jgi:hypothetical protein